ncbi:MAG: MarR family winged helix-turn-helix transcriptional regulator [Pyrinomonadaceae bacterium]
MSKKIPQNSADQVIRRLMLVGDRLWRDSDKRFAKWNLTENHYNILRVLHSALEPISQAKIGRQLLSSRANITKLLDRLEEQGVVERMVCADRRVNLVGLTKKGTQFLVKTITEAMDFAEEMMKPLTRQEQKTLYELLGRLLPEGSGSQPDLA